jgi:hypothetical protein
MRQATVDKAVAAPSSPIIRYYFFIDPGETE